MKKLQSLITQCTLKVLNGGECPLLTKISAKYKDQYKILRFPFDYIGGMQEEVGKKIADIYESIEHKPNDAIVTAAYKQMAKEIQYQFQFILDNSKIQFEPYVEGGEPYSNSHEMLEDIHNNHMYFFKTESGFGEREYTETNLMLAKTEFTVGDYKLLVNDLFRIVHDIFGHAMKGNSFGPKGEDRAWFDHLQMFSPLAAAALSMETRGQNCWVNFGKHLRNENNELWKKEHEEWIPPHKRPFAEQKMNILPSFVTGIEVYKKDNEIKARYIDIWDPILSILKT